jgi:hypothetical protein
MQPDPFPRRATLLFRDVAAADLVSAIEALNPVPHPYAISSAYLYWQLPSDDAPLLDVHLIADIPDYEVDLTLETYTTWWMPLKRSLGGDPSAALLVNFAAGSAGEQALRDFAAALLAQHAGIMQIENASTSKP